MTVDYTKKNLQRVSFKNEKFVNTSLWGVICVVLISAAPISQGLNHPFK